MVTFKDPIFTPLHEEKWTNVCGTCILDLFFHLEKLHLFELVKLLFTNLVATAYALISFGSFFCHQFDMPLKGM
jgi:hypothetical protein